MITLTCIAQVSQVQKYISHFNFSKTSGIQTHAFSKATLTISGYFHEESSLAVQIANIECFRARSTSYICSIDLNIPDNLQG